jgi:hypothetical protein
LVISNPTTGSTILLAHPTETQTVTLNSFLNIRNEKILNKVRVCYRNTSNIIVAIQFYYSDNVSDKLGSPNGSGIVCYNLDLQSNEKLLGLIGYYKNSPNANISRLGIIAGKY